jgi:hypothetical protein
MFHICTPPLPLYLLDEHVLAEVPQKKRWDKISFKPPLSFFLLVIFEKM